MADVTFVRDEVVKATPIWSQVADVCAGGAAVKAATTTYLPQPNALDTSEENAERYKQYVARAVFYNATGRTLQSLVGAVFRVDPELQVPGAIEYVGEDVDGAGVSVYQQSQAVLRQVLKIGRHALLVDYPTVDAPASRADMATGKVRATIASYEAKQVTNWRVDRIGSKHVLTMLVLSECREVPTADGFGLQSEDQYRVLRLANGVYTQEIWRKSTEADSKGKWVLAEGPFSVLNGAGGAWQEIPFTFVGSNNNDPNVDPAPLADLTDVNLGHYRNSADYEDSVYLSGQPQLFLAGLSEEWRDWLQKQGIFVGSRAPMLLPVGGSAVMLQAQPNTLAREAMQDKQEQMVALGARLLQPGGAVKTATEAQGEQEAEHSVLSLACSNVSEAYTRCLGWMADFMAAGGATVDYALNQDFVEQHLDPAMLTALIAAWQSGKLPEGDLWAQLRQYGVIDPEKTDEDIKGELETQDPGLNLAANETLPGGAGGAAAAAG